MPTYEKATVIPTDFDTVWEFYDGVEELRILTPDWIGLEIPRVIGPDDEPNPAQYLEGTEIYLEVRPFGSRLVPPIEWVVEIVEREESDDRAYFIDEQVGDRGPYDTWRHLHQFVDLGGETLVCDRITYKVPHAGTLPLASPVLAGMLWYRHRRTRALLGE